MEQMNDALKALKDPRIREFYEKEMQKRHENELQEQEKEAKALAEFEALKKAMVCPHCGR